VIPPGLDTAVYEVMAVPPLLPGAVKATVAVLNAVAVAVPTVGVPGVPKVVTAELAELAAPVPTAFVALTTYVYAVLLEPPVADIGDDAPVNVLPPGLRVTVYPVIAEPLLAGAVKDTDCVPTPVLVALTLVGAPGTAQVVMLLDAELDALLPAAFVA